jgi:hypothetical protein
MLIVSRFRQLTRSHDAPRLVFMKDEIYET